MKSNKVVWVVVIVCTVCFILTVCISCLIFGLVSSQTDGFDPGFPSQTGSLVPDHQLESIDGEQISLTDFWGKPVLVNF